MEVYLLGQEVAFQQALVVGFLQALEADFLQVRVVVYPPVLAVVCRLDHAEVYLQDPGVECQLDQRHIIAIFHPGLFSYGSSEYVAFINLLS
jgi:hypothetical protein